MLRAKMVSAKEIKNLREEGVAVKEILDVGMVFLLSLAEAGVTADETGLAQEQLENAWIKVTDRIVERAGADLDRLTATALEDFRERVGDDIKPVKMSELFAEFQVEGAGGEFLYVAPRFIENGGVILADTETLEAFAQEKESDLYIIPSSKHEILIIPEKEKPEDLTEEYMRGIIGHVNRTQVQDEDILSDNLYHYTRGLRRLEVILPIGTGA